jgi:SAM-dependent methyltransferase
MADLTIKEGWLECTDEYRAVTARLTPERSAAWSAAITGNEGAACVQTETNSALAPVSLKVDWDYTGLADSYVHRPGYAPHAISTFLNLAGPAATRMVIDLGAGTGLLTERLAERCGEVVALEPNHAMRRHGIARTSGLANVRWMVGRMEDTGLPPGRFSLATCGSSFGVADHGATLREIARILEPAGWFACLWNYRDLQDPLQRDIESHIKASIPGFQYGARREDQTPIIMAGGLFGHVQIVQAGIRHRLPKHEWIDAWRSHATLQRQAGSQFQSVVDGIAAIVDGIAGDTVEIPYVTRVWVAQSCRAVVADGGN